MKLSAIVEAAAARAERAAAASELPTAAIDRKVQAAALPSITTPPSPRRKVSAEELGEPNQATAALVQKCLGDLKKVKA
jgi:hypothetical protein